VKKSRRIILFVGIFILISSIPASAASPGSMRGSQTWTIQTLDNDEPNIVIQSSTFGGKHQVPMFSYYSADTEELWLFHQQNTENIGQIGPWTRRGIVTPDIYEGFISNPDIFLYGSDTFGVKWVYGTTEETLRGAGVEYMNDMSFVGRSSEVLADLDKLGGELVGAPSLQADGRWFRIAFTVYDWLTEPTPVYKLMYMYKTGELNDSCLWSGTSYYQCDVIDTNDFSIGPPSLQLAPGGKVGIAYEKDGVLMYAYPHEHLDVFPSNCGPGHPETWRCIPIYDDTNVGSDVQLAFGQTTGRGILYNRDNALFIAQYVGSGGNCGWDGHHLFPDNQWQCLLLAGLENNPNPSYSIAIDPYGYPVIAYDNAPEALGPKNLYIQYQLGHIGLEPSNTWRTDVIDPAPNMDVDNGREAAIALNNLGTGFIAYIQDDNWDPYNPIDRLKIAFQPIFRNYLPMVVD